ncbi:hypothetical protein NQ315_011177 [Exocentrus adspersus]|uniref:RNase H type-1 domain-containing protein n=1 Tax=Exocentrus adspersus TaxID=1586481 RepID=A0AAV8VAA3_9CUCU|nr:hypothetical protein NQ315_011177 [Exocentrus adspersus]
MRKTELSLPLGRYTSIFQTEVYALLQCARENNLRAYRNKRINILTDSQATIKGLRNHKMTCKLLWEYWKELSDLARHNRVELLWVPRHSGIKGNEKADELARKGSSASYIGPEPAVGVSKTMIMSQVKEWVNSQHKEYWKNITRDQHEWHNKPNAAVFPGTVSDGSQEEKKSAGVSRCA